MEFPTDLLNIILDYLSPTDMAPLLPLFEKEVTKHITKQTINRINHRLNKFFGLRTNEFKKLLKKYNAVISGSFVLQCILDEDWQSDVDIYIATEGNIMESTGSYPTCDIDQFLLDFFDGGYSTHGGYKLINDREYISVRSFDYDKKNIFQTIFIKRNKTEIYDYIKQQFDFDICKNIYDGNKLEIYNLSDVLSKTTDFNVTNGLTTSGRRYLKYTARNIIFRNISTFDYMKHDYQLTKPKYITLFEVTFINPHIHGSPLDCPHYCIVKICDPDKKHTHTQGYDSAYQEHCDYITI